MAHNLLGKSFYQNRTQPAWHGLGINDPTEHTAEQALRRFNPDAEPFGVQKIPMFITLPDGSVEQTGHFMIVREPTPEDNQWRVISKSPVSEEFETFDPLDTARLCDRHITNLKGKPVPVETLGILGKHGDRMFVTYALPKIGIQGDEVQMYLVFDSPLTNNISMGGYTTGIRTVCENTLQAGIGAANQRFQVTHAKGASEQVAAWMSGMYARALAASGEMKTAFVKMAKTPVSDLQINWIVEAAYPLPTVPLEDAPGVRRTKEARQVWYEERLDRVARRRKTVIDLINGQGIGMDSPALAGTAYGAYNGIAEFETYRKGNLAVAVGSLINGDRANVIRNGFQLCLHADQWESVTPEAIGVITYAEADPA